MAKSVDNNGYWYIKRNPISKVGVFPYLGRTISDECVPDKIYHVLRPAETLRDSVPTWDNPPKPFINDHEMIGEGFTKIDDRPVQGIIYNPVFDENDGILYADLAVYSEDLKDQISNGKKELSLGYFCKYEKRPGVYKGQAYDFVQLDMVGNHCALVDAGRCGGDVKVFDHKCTMDALDINPTDFEAQDTDTGNQLNKNQESQTIDREEEITHNQRKGKMADKREFIREIMALAAKPTDDFKGGESEKIDTIAKLLEQSEYAKSERGASDEDDTEEKPATDKCGKDEDSEKTEEKKTEDEDKEEKETEDSLDPAEVMAFLRAIMERLDMVLNKKSVTDEDDAEKTDEEKKTEDSDEDKKDSEDEDEETKEDDKKSAEDSAVFVLGDKKTALDAADDAALQDYLK